MKDSRGRTAFDLIALALLAGLLSCAAAAASEPINVAVYTGGTPPPYGCKGVYEALAAAQGIRPAQLSTLEPHEFTRYPVLVMASAVNLSSPDMGRPYEAILRNYVEQGGSVLVAHFATGLVKGAPRAFNKSLFPEIWKPVGKVKSFTMEPAEGDHPVVKGLPETIRHGYADHIQLEARPAGMVLAIDEEGKAVAICGAYGKGRVLALGNAVGRWRCW